MVDRAGTRNNYMAVTKDMEVNMGISMDITLDTNRANSTATSIPTGATTEAVGVGKRNMGGIK